MSQIIFHFDDSYKTDKIIDEVAAYRNGWSKEKFSVYVTAYSKEDGDSICSFDVNYKSFKKKGLTFDFQFNEEESVIEVNVVGDATMKLRPGVAHEIENSKGGVEYRVKWIRIKEDDQGPYNASLYNEEEKVLNNVTLL